MNKNFFIALCIIVVAQILTFFQLQGQFISDWMKKHQFLVSLIGVLISYLLLSFTKYCALAFNGQVWPGRLIGFAIGVTIFALCAHFALNEPLTSKTIVCLILASAILLIQIFW